MKRFLGWSQRKQNIVGAIVILLLVLVCAADVKASNLKTFRDGVMLNGVLVSGMTVEEATQKLNEEFNSILFIDDYGTKERIETEFVFDNQLKINNALRISYFDPRAIMAHSKDAATVEGADYEIPLIAVKGVMKTGAKLHEKFPPKKGMTVTKDAYVDYKTVSVVKEVQGNNPDYFKISKAIADQRAENPTKDSFKCKLSDYVAEPKIRTTDLDDELKFAKEYIAPGMDVITPNGDKVHIGPELLSKIINYSKKGPVYSEDGAAEVASEVALMSTGNGTDTEKVMTVEGERELYNYAITGAINVKKSAKSLLEAAKTKGVGTVYKDKEKLGKLGDHVEVSIGSQTVYLVQNGKVTASSPCVTGNYGSETPTGIYKVAWMTSPATLRGDNGDGTQYASKVSFWIPFNGPIGLHDAGWRNAFGGNIYKGNGSHGCVNLPYHMASTLYNALSPGYIVIVY